MALHVVLPFFFVVFPVCQQDKVFQVHLTKLCAVLLGRQRERRKNVQRSTCVCDRYCIVGVYDACRRFVLSFLFYLLGYTPVTSCF